MFSYSENPIFKEIKQDYAKSEKAGLQHACHLAKRAGLFKACLPKNFGSGELFLNHSLQAYNNVFACLRSLGYANPALGRIFEGHINAIQLIACYGRPAQSREIFTNLSKGKLIGIWATDSHNPVHAKLTASGKYELTGSKIYASGADLLDYALITTETANQAGQSLAVVNIQDKSRAQIEHWPASGMLATASGEYNFDKIYLTKKDFIGSPNNYLQEPYFDGGVWRYCAIQLGCAEAIVKEWHEMLEKRKRLADNIQRARLAKAKITCLACAASLIQAINKLARAAIYNEKNNIDLSVAAALAARKITEDSCIYILKLCEKALGLQAFLKTNEIEQRRRDLSIFLRQAAPDYKLQRAANILLQQADKTLW